MATSGLQTDLAGKVVLITGASSGIGQAAAIEFAKAGALIAITGRSQEGLQKTKEICQNNRILPDSHIFLIPDADLLKEDYCRRIVEETVTKFGQLDVLVNAAGIIVRGTIETLSPDDFDKPININTRSVFLIMQAAIPHLKKTQGNIVNVSSVNGIRSFPGVLSYNVSKSALDQLTRCAALELAAYNVRVNSVNPGVIVTEIHKRGGLNDQDYEAFLERTKTTHALGRPGQPEEVAKGIVFLGSNALSGFITGVQLPIDGGRSVMCPR